MEYLRIFSEDIEKCIELKINDGALSYKNNNININKLDFDLIRKNNDLVNIEAPEIDNLPAGYGFIDKETKLGKIYNYKDKTFAFEIKDNNIEFYHIYNYHYLTIAKNDVIRSNEFKKGTFAYDALLETFDKEQISINAFMFLSFLKNEPKIRKKLFNQPSKKLEKVFKNQDLLRNILLMDDEFKLEFDFDIAYAQKVLEGASLSQIPIILKKIPVEKLDKMDSLKLIRRIASIDTSLLSNRQLKLHEDEEKQKEMLIQEYKYVIGEITTMGIRERIKSFNKKQLNVIGKNTKKWLDENIGHSKEYTTITESQLNKAKSIISDFKKAIDI